jgi:hypothetical protein
MSSTATNPTAQGSNHVNRRAFLAGGAATTALIAGAIVLFTSLAAYVAFNGLSESDSEAPNQATVLVGTTTGAPDAAAQALGGDRGDGVAASPTAPTPVAPEPAPAPVAGAPALSTPGTAAPAATTPGIDTGSGTQEGVAGADPNEPDGTLGNTVDDLDNAAGNLGLDLPLNEVTDNITEPLDNTLNNTLNNVGGLLGNPNLGDQVTSGLNSTTQNLLGEGGLTDQLLGGNR